MDPITNSLYKEEIRKANESQAKKQEFQIKKDLGNRCQDINSSSLSITIAIAVGSVILGITTAIIQQSPAPIGLCLVLGVIIWICTEYYFFQKRKELKDKAEEAIKQAYSDADKKTTREIKQYNAEAKEFAKKAYRQGSKLDPMVNHTVTMFQRMISHANADTYIKFIEANLIFTVEIDGISFGYESGYINPLDDYNFEKKRFRNLNSLAECEGLARALTKMTIKKMKALYPPDSIHISFSHNDATVTLHFKGANPNFIPAQNIV